MAKITKYLYIKKNWCKQCMFCVEFCPRDVIEVGEDGYPRIVDITKCRECTLCISLCPEFAIITEPEVTEQLEVR